MLYGLIDPYILEGLLAMGAGAAAPFALRIVQFLIAAAGFYLIYRTFSSLESKISRFRAASFTAAAVMSSAVILIESLEITPEIVMFTAVSLLLYRLVTYRPSLKNSVILGVVFTLLAGSRPTAVMLGFPAVIILPEFFSRKSICRRFWRWIVAAVSISASVLFAFPDLAPRTAVIAASVIVLAAVTVLSVVLDLRWRRTGAWKHLGIVLVSFTATLPLVFPNYFLHFPELIRQTRQFYLDIVQPAGDPGVFFRQLFYSILYITIAFPGILSGLGLYAGLGAILSGRSSVSNYRLPLLFFLGTVPFFLFAIGKTDYQPRYLIPLMGFVFLLAAKGLTVLMRMRKVRVLLLIPLLLSCFQLYEIFSKKTHGGILNAMYELSLLESPRVGATALNPCLPELYSMEDDICWPLVPFVNGTDPVWRPEAVDHWISFSPPPEDFAVIRSFDTGNEHICRSIRSSRRPGWISLLYLIREPWIWRESPATYLAERRRL